MKLLPYTGFKGGTDIERERALGKLRRDLIIAPLIKSNMIRVKYTSTSPKTGVPLLEAMASSYLDEHLELHGNAGSFEFFDRQAREAENRWKDAQKNLLEFEKTSGVVSGAEEKDLLLRRQIELEVVLHQAEAELRDTGRRIESIRPRLDAMAPRIATQSRRVPNQYSVERLNTMLAELQNRRTEMLAKYRPTDRNVTQLDQEIADTHKALEEAQGRASTEEQTDVNPLRQSLEGDLARAEETNAGLSGRIQTMRTQDEAYRRQLQRIEQYMPLEQQLRRDEKVAEENYLLYAKRREEARIGQRMDQEKIANVVLSERPVEPVLPKGRGGPLMGVYLLALALSLVAVAIGARMRHTVETPWDIEAIADAPVLGTVPVHDFAAPLPERMRGFS